METCSLSFMFGETFLLCRPCRTGLDSASPGAHLKSCSIRLAQDEASQILLGLGTTRRLLILEYSAFRGRRHTRRDSPEDNLKHKGEYLRNLKLRETDQK